MEIKTIIELESPVAPLYSLTSQKEDAGREELPKGFFVVIKGAFDWTTFQKLCVLPKFRQHHPLCVDGTRVKWINFLQTSTFCGRVGADS